MKQGSGLFLEAQGHPLLEHSKTKSNSALSRFLNINPWSTREMIRTVRNHILKQIQEESNLGRKPFLEVIVDLTTLEKCGKFKEFENLISVYNGKRGLHLVVLYLVFGKWRIPWSFRICGGKGTTIPAQLGLKLVQHLPKIFSSNFQTLILADTAFGSRNLFTAYVNSNIMQLSD